MKYQPLHTPCDLSETSLEDAMIRICAATDDQGRVMRSPIEYKLRVSDGQRIRAGRLLEQLNLVNVGRTPFRIHVELVADPEYSDFEWSVHANGKAFGSEAA